MQKDGVNKLDSNQENMLLNEIVMETSVNNDHIDPFNRKRTFPFDIKRI